MSIGLGEDEFWVDTNTASRSKYEDVQLYNLVSTVQLISELRTASTSASTLASSLSTAARLAA